MDISKKMTGLILTGIIAIWGAVSLMAGGTGEQQIALAFVFGIWTMIVKN